MERGNWGRSMSVFACGGSRYRFRSGVLRIGLGGAPAVSFAIEGEDAERGGLRNAAVAREVGTVELATGVGASMQLRGVSRTDWWTEGRQQGPPSTYFHGVVLPEALGQWLAAEPEEGGAGRWLLYQCGEGTGRCADFLRGVVGDERFRAGGEDGLEAPVPGACLVRPGWMTNREFLNLVVGELAGEDPSLVGWRVVPGADGAVCMVVSGGEAVELDPESWSVGEEFGELGAGRREKPTRVRTARGPYRSFGETVEELFGVVQPGDRMFAGEGGPIPCIPGWVFFRGRARFAIEVAIHFKEAGAGEGHVITAVDLDLADEPPRAGVGGVLARTFRGRVEGWSEDGETVALAPADETWSVAVGSSSVEAGLLSGRCLTPASFGGERGGIYLRPQKGDLRIVTVVQGEPAFTAAAPMPRQDEMEGAEVDIAVVGSRVQLSDGWAAAGALDGEAGMALAAEKIGIEGKVRVTGDLDVS